MNPYPENNKSTSWYKRKCYPMCIIITPVNSTSYTQYKPGIMHMVHAVLCCCGLQQIFFTNTLQCYSTGIGAIIWLPQCRWSNIENICEDMRICYMNTLRTGTITTTKQKCAYLWDVMRPRHDIHPIHMADAAIQWSLTSARGTHTIYMGILQYDTKLELYSMLLWYA